MSKEITIEQEVSPLVAKAQAFEITKVEDMPKAVTMLSELNKMLDRITTEKEKVTKPLNEALKAERGRWKPSETILETAIGYMRKSITAYQTEQKRIADAELDKIAARVAPGKGNLNAPTATAKMDAVEKPEESVTTNAGNVTFRTDKKCEVENITKIPYEYLIPDMVKIRAAMKAGTEITGVRYWEEETVINRR